MIAQFIDNVTDAVVSLHPGLVGPLRMATVKLPPGEPACDGGGHNEVVANQS